MAGHKLAPKPQPVEGHLLIANILGFATLFLKNRRTASMDEHKQALRFISRLFRFDTDDEHTAGELLDRLLEVDLDIAAMATTFKKHSNTQMRLRLLEILATLSLLIHCPLENGHLALLAETAGALDLTQGQWQAIKSRYRAPSPTLDTACCYALMEIYPEVSVVEVRAAYRRLAKKYHPDRVAHLDHAAQQQHIERMTLINSAYDTIRAERGF
jgi:DnaJ like chaperone protein